MTIAIPGNPTIVYSAVAGTSTIGSLTTSDPFSISGGSLEVTANSTLSGGLSMTGGSLTVSVRASRSPRPCATTVSSGSLTAAAGATLSLPQLTSIVGGADPLNHTSTLEATGAGSLLSLPNLATLSTSTQFGDSLTQIEAADGGKVDLPALTEIYAGSTQLSSQGSGSE